MRASTARTWDSSTPDWELDNSVPHHGTTAMMNSIQMRLKAKGIRIPNASRLHRAVLNLSNQGVDTQLNHVNHNVWRKGLFLHLVWLNSVNVSIDTTANKITMLTASQVTAVKRLLDMVMLDSPESLANWNTPHLYESYQKLLSAILGLASIEPGLIDQLEDIETGKKLTLDDLVPRFSIEWGHDMIELDALPRDLYSAMLHSKVDLRRLRGSAMPDDFLPIVELVLSRMFVEYPGPYPGFEANRQYYDSFGREVCTVISEHWLANYSTIYRM
jgi:hypothetical protein